MMTIICWILAYLIVAAIVTWVSWDDYGYPEQAIVVGLAYPFFAVAVLLQFVQDKWNDRQYRIRDEEQKYFEFLDEISRL